MTTSKTLSTSPQIQDIGTGDHGRVVELNDAEVQWTSPMDLGQFEALLRHTCYARTIQVDGQTAGFLIAMDQTADYDNGNFAWFKTRYDRFCYIDRIVIDVRNAAKGLGPAFYADLFEFARRNALDHVVCEYNVEPMNEPSRKFHTKMGFTEVGQRTLETKTVSMQLATINQS